MTTCLVALGSNLGDRAGTLDAAIKELACAEGIELARQSAWQMTMPVGGGEEQPPFLNGAAIVETSLSPQDLLALLQKIESRLGRERHKRWGDRTLDLDLLLYGEEVIETPELTVPHPRMSFRRFVLEPAAEIAGSLVHPTIRWTIDQLLDQLDEGGDCLAIVAPDAAARGELAAKLVERFGFAVSEPTVSSDTQLWPAAWTSRLLVPNGEATSAAHPKLTILLAAPAVSDKSLGPTLRISDTWRDAVEHEVFAAVEAVWPRLGLTGG